MLDRIPNAEDLIRLMGKSRYDVWEKLTAMIEEAYDMEPVWNGGGKKWTYEYKYRRGGKTLCALYAKENGMGFMVILGKEEREKFEAQKEQFTQSIQKTYEEAQVFHDGKWVMFEPVDTWLFQDFAGILAIKRKPNRK